MTRIDVHIHEIIFSPDTGYLSFIIFMVFLLVHFIKCDIQKMCFMNVLHLLVEWLLAWKGRTAHLLDCTCTCIRLPCSLAKTETYSLFFFFFFFFRTDKTPLQHFALVIPNRCMFTCFNHGSVSITSPSACFYSLPIFFFFSFSFWPFIPHEWVHRSSSGIWSGFPWKRWIPVPGPKTRLARRFLSADCRITRTTPHFWNISRLSATSSRRSWSPTNTRASPEDMAL